MKYYNDLFFGKNMKVINYSLILALVFLTGLTGCEPSEEEIKTQKQNKILKAEKIILKNKLSKTEQANEDLNSEIVEVTDKLEMANVKIDKSETESIENQNKVQELKNEVTELRDKEAQVPDTTALDSLIAKKEGMLKQADLLKAKLDKQLLEMEVKFEKLQVKLQAQKKSSEAELSDAQEKVSLANISYVKMKHDFVSLQEKLASQKVKSEDDLVRAQEKAKQASKDYKGMLEKNKALKNADLSNHSQLSELRQTLETTQLEIARFTGARGTYTVQPNDSLSGIASFFYRDGNEWLTIWKANQFVLKKPNLIYSGMVLVIPQI